jgi:hypothetical protein
MAQETEVKELNGAIAAALAYKQKDLISRPEWGSIKFDGASADFERIYSVLSYLSILPLNYLADSTVIEIKRCINEVKNTFEQIDKFTIEQSNASQTRTNYVEQLHIKADNFYKIASPWIPFLAYQKGDVTKNIEALTNSVIKAQGLVDDAKTQIKLKVSEIDGIISKAREASASAGAAVFTQDFLEESQRLQNQASSWLKATAAFAFLTLGVAFILWHFTEPGLDQGQLLQKLGTKLVVLILLFTGTLWCGKIYRALMHQAAQHKHRALGLKTFQAFSHAASDNQTKDAVLMETTRSIFSNTQTGYIGQDSSDSDVKIVEIVRSILAKDGK